MTQRARGGVVRLLVLLGVVASVLAGCGTTRVDPAVIRTPDGLLRGLMTTSHTAWLGVPYAAPPVGFLRWQPPAPVTPWDGVLPATTSGPACPQGGRPEGATSESCLHLDVYRPPDTTTQLPVVVFIHGGGFVAGAASDVEPTRLVVGGHLIVVSIDYRLGALGFLAVPGLESPSSAGGSFGLQDQEAALRWVNRSIAAFGGDPGRVAIVGESAGGISVCDLLVSPPASGLFSAAIDQSGPCVGPDAALPTVGEATFAGNRWAETVGCGAGPNQPACLRRVPVDKLTGGPPEVTTGVVPIPWRPVIDGAVMPDQPEQLLSNGRASHVAVLAGSNLDDGATFLPASVTSEARYTAWLVRVFGSAASAAASTYPVSQSAGADTVRAVASRVATDSAFACPALLANQLMAATNGLVWGYEFADRSIDRAGAFHSAELGYLFTSVAGRHDLAGGHEALSATLVAAWSEMARAGVPGGSWPQSGGQPSAVAHFEAKGIAVDSDFSLAHHCDFWASSGGGR